MFRVDSFSVETDPNPCLQMHCDLGKGVQIAMIVLRTSAICHRSTIKPWLVILTCTIVRHPEKLESL